VARNLSAALFLAAALAPALATALPPVFGRRVVHAVQDGPGVHPDRPTLDWDSLSWTASRGAWQVVPADVDRDGDLDLVSVSTLRDELAWHENDGADDPSFSARVVTHNPHGRWVPAVIAEPRSVAVADLDGDGDPDLVTASSFDDKIAWFEHDGAGDPSFTAHVISADPDGGGPAQGALDVASWVTPADLDGDSDVDIVALGNAGRVVWFENLGGASGWTLRQLRPALYGPPINPTLRFVALPADLDGDGDLDVAVQGGGWFENLGPPSPPSFAARSAQIDAMTLGDYDGDGDVDLASAWPADDTISWFENDGADDPSFTRRVAAPAPDAAMAFVRLASTDLDGDQDLDLLLASPGLEATLSGGITWIENLGGAAQWQARKLSAGLQRATSVHATDLDADGRMDVLSTGIDGDSVLWHRQQPAPRTLPFTLTLESHTTSWPRIEPLSVSSVGVASIQAGPGGALTQVDLVGGFAGTATGEPVSPTFLHYGGAALGLATARFGRSGGTGVLTGYPFWCSDPGPIATSCLGGALLEGGAGPGVGGMAVFEDLGSVRISVLGAPWTLGTATVAISDPPLPVQTYTARGFAHGPLSNTGTTAAEGGALQLVTPVHTRFGSTGDRAAFVRLTLHFVPEPGSALSLSLGALALAVLGRRKRRVPA
jgi:hypothetical protein